MKPIVHRWRDQYEYSPHTVCGILIDRGNFLGPFAYNRWHRGDRRCKNCEKALRGRK